jgi:hypothetical protein
MPICHDDLHRANLMASPGVPPRPFLPHRPSLTTCTGCTSLEVKITVIHRYLVPAPPSHPPSFHASHSFLRLAGLRHSPSVALPVPRKPRYDFHRLLEWPPCPQSGDTSGTANALHIEGILGCRSGGASRLGRGSRTVCGVNMEEGKMDDDRGWWRDEMEKGKGRGEDIRKPIAARPSTFAFESALRSTMVLFAYV